MAQYIDFKGRKVNLDSPPESIVSLNPSITETLFLIGMGERVKGVSAFCRRPAEVERIRKIGSYSTYNEKIMDDINPDLILTISGYQDSLADNLAKKYNLYQLELPSTPFQILDMINRIGIVAGKVREARVLSIELIKKMKTHLPQFRAYVEIDLGGPVTFGSQSYIISTLNTMGFETPYDCEPKEWIMPDYDVIKKFDPEIIIMEGKMYRGMTKEEAMERLKEHGLEKTSAFHKGRVFTTPGKLDFLAHHGPDFFNSAIPWIENIYQLMSDESKHTNINTGIE